GSSTYPPQGVSPNSSWLVRFSNPIDVDKLELSMISVVPEVAGLRIVARRHWENALEFDGRKRENTTYKVTIDASLPDVYGQTLGQSCTVTFKTGAAGPAYPWLNPAPNP